MKAERERAEKAEMRVRALEQALSSAKARVAELEGEVESERRRRDEWESGLEQLAMGVTGPSAAAARL
jgi:chromosome segregation ATPase